MRTENWEILANRLLSPGAEDRGRVALELSEQAARDRNGREFVANYLTIAHGSEVTNPVLSFLLMTFNDSPAREEVAVAEKYWGEGRTDALMHTSIIIERGNPLYTAQERSGYINRAKHMYDSLLAMKSDSNYRDPLVTLVGELEGRKSLPWMTWVMGTDPAGCPNVGRAAEYVTRFDPPAAAKAWVDNLRVFNSDPIHVSIAIRAAMDLRDNLTSSDVAFLRDHAQKIIAVGSRIQGSPSELGYKQWAYQHTAEKFTKPDEITGRSFLDTLE